MVSATAEDFVDAETKGRQLGFGALVAAEESPRYVTSALPNTRQTREQR